MFYLSKSRRALLYFRLIATGLVLSAGHGSPSFAAHATIAVQVEWNQTLSVSKTTATVMHMVHPVSRKGMPMHDKGIAALKELNAQYVRYMNWDVYPRLSVAALEPPTKTKTSWDFTLIDAELVPFLEATRGREPVVSFAAIPAWMFKNDRPVSYPDDPNEVSLVRHGKELLDPSGEQVAQYFARIASWYTQGGFTDENGKYHRSGHHFELPWWEVLNEAESFTPEQYTRISDAVITAVRKVSPKTRFIGLSLAAGKPEIFEYWLNPKNHRPDIALDMIAYHFYAHPHTDLLKYEPPDWPAIELWQYTFFDQTEAFINNVKYIESIRKRLSPSTRSNLNEIGTYAPGDFDVDAQDTYIPPAYWNLSAGVFAYLYMELAKQGIDILAQSLLVAGPKMAPGNTMMNWNTGKPNARYHVTKMLIDHFAPGDQLVATVVEPKFNINLNRDLAAQAFKTPAGNKLLLINKRAFSLDVELATPDLVATMSVVDERSNEDPPRQKEINSTRVHLSPFAVAVLTIEPLPRHE